MTSSCPLLSIGLPIFNEQAHIEESLLSLQRQDYASIEILISDNASTDSTLDICRRIADTDPRISIFANDENRGAVWNFQNVLALAKGDYFMWGGAHDRLEPSFASRCIRALQQSPAIVSAFPSAVFIDESGESVSEIPTAYDTRGLSVLVRPWVTAWLLSTHYAYPIYGVHRTGAIREAFVPRKCIGPDVVTLFHLAFLGATAFVSGTPQIAMRMRHDYGDWDAYLGKVYGTARVSYREAVGDMRKAYSSVISTRTGLGRHRLLHWLLLSLFMPAIRNWASVATKRKNI